MAITIGLGVWAGLKMDEKYALGRPYFTLVGSVLGLAISLVVVFRSLLKK
jgi:F0F1-type ATP synthase assembly protein I